MTTTTETIERALQQGEADGFARRSKRTDFARPDERRAYDQGYSNGVRQRVDDPRTTKRQAV